MADFYGTAVNFTSYVTARGYAAVVGNQAAIEAALLVASEWIDGKYRASFMAPPGYSNIRSYRIYSDIGTFKTGGRFQVREWPRTGFVDIYGYAIDAYEIPREVENATYEVAYRQMTTPGSLYTDNAQSKYRRVSIDGAIAVEYAGASTMALQLDIPIVDEILSGLIGGGTGANLSGLSGRSQRAQ